MLSGLAVYLHLDLTTRLNTTKTLQPAGQINLLNSCKPSYDNYLLQNSAAFSGWMTLRGGKDGFLLVSGLFISIFASHNSRFWSFDLDNINNFHLFSLSCLWLTRWDYTALKVMCDVRFCVLHLLGNRDRTHWVSRGCLTFNLVTAVNNLLKELPGWGMIWKHGTHLQKSWRVCAFVLQVNVSWISHIHQERK